MNDSLINQDFHDINRIPGNGLLVFPLSMSRLHMGQDPKSLYDFLLFFEKKITEKTVDIIFLYANGLYFNSESISSSVREKTNTQMITHKQELLKIIKNDNHFVPAALHFVPWDWMILNTKNYLDIYATLKNLKNTDNDFSKLLEYEIGSRNLIDANYNFILEESIATYLIREKLVNLPMNLSHPGGWHLICYPGNCLLPDVYIYQKKILPNPQLIHHNWFSRVATASMYDMFNKKLITYENINFSNFIEEDKKIIPYETV